MSHREHESPPASRRSSFGHPNMPPPSPFKRISQRVVPPPRPRMKRTTSKHMLPSSTQSRNQSVFSSKHRLVTRDLPFFQSKNRLQVTNQHSSLRLWTLLYKDWFHVVLRLNLMMSVLMMLSIWTIAIIIFAGVYMMVDQGSNAATCGLGANGEPIHFGPAFAFSLETCTTVGYGLPSGTNAFFEDECNGVVIAIYFQMVWSMLFNAFLFAFFYTRIAKSESRGVQVIFSHRAIVSHRLENPLPCFSFRVFDVDARHPVVEAHVRMYVVSQRSPIPMPLRILIPNDELAGVLFLSLPSQVVHTIDGYSPLCPKSQAKCEASATVPSEGLHLRQVDSSTNSREDVICPVCGESYGTVERLIKHGKYQDLAETADGYPYRGSHREVDWNEWRDLLKKSATWTIKQLEAYFRSSISEIVCVVEGIDPLASGTFQALHSYQIEDICFGSAHFADCVCLNRKGQCVVDLDFFHRINEGDRTEREVKKQEESKGKGSSRSLFGTRRASKKGSSRQIVVDTAILQESKLENLPNVEDLPNIENLPMIPSLFPPDEKSSHQPNSSAEELTPQQQLPSVEQQHHHQQQQEDEACQLEPQSVELSSKSDLKEEINAKTSDAQQNAEEKQQSPPPIVRTSQPHELQRGPPADYDETQPSQYRMEAN